jgi:hypothetical protein
MNESRKIRRKEGRKEGREEGRKERKKALGNFVGLYCVSFTEPLSKSCHLLHFTKLSATFLFIFISIFTDYSTTKLS